MAKSTGEVNWNPQKELTYGIEQKMIKWAWEATLLHFAPAVRRHTPIYKGPPRPGRGGGIRRPGALRSGIQPKKMKKWSQVFIPHPGLFVNYGVNVENFKTPFRNPKKGRQVKTFRSKVSVPTKTSLPKVSGKMTRPTLFIQKGMDEVFGKAVNMAKGII